ncbi:uncharacterized protein NPIL_560831 [Nephila pilipes]|uniref:Uncharacterized protein n=1 Tax=Nephila pilipes TaxID=299642 RepID=A0A8X6NY11_NEPPI|nr:uncharacterized protein NPIL_560831 [Nephila pilipes]
MKDFFEIFVYTLIKIVNRTVWILHEIGAIEILEKSRSLIIDNCIQTDVLTKKNGENASFEQMKTEKFFSSPSEKSPICNLQLSVSPTTLTGKYEQTSFMNESPGLSDEPNSPAVLKLEAEFPNTITFQPSSRSQSPVCNINLSLSPRVLTKYTQADAEEFVSGDGRFLKKICNSWKSKQSDEIIQSVVQNHHEKSNEILKGLKKTKIISDDNSDNKIHQHIEEPYSPKVFDCCNIVMSKLKSKFQKKNSFTTISYSRF